MFRNTINTYSPPAHDDLSVKANQEVTIILNFIDRSISGFGSYYFAIKDSDRENRISDFLTYYFNVCLLDEKAEGFPPFNFGKNPSQPVSGKETDIGVVVLTKDVKPITIIEFEAKRLSPTSNNKEYVCGEKGGIERFKREKHASHLSICGMFGYIQSKTIVEWVGNINKWILEQTGNNSVNSIIWSTDEQLIAKSSFGQVEKWFSTNSRLTKPNIDLHHYFINLS